MISFGSTLNCKNLVFYTPVFTLNSKKNIVHSTGLNFIWCEINIFINKSYFLYMWLPLFAWHELVVIWALWKVWYQKLKQIDILLHSQVLIGHSNFPYKIVYFLLVLNLMNTEPYLHNKTKGRICIKTKFNPQNNISLLHGRCFSVYSFNMATVTSCEHTLLYLHF